MRRLAAWIAILSFAAGLILPASVSAHAPDDPDAAWGAARLLAGHPTDQIEPVRGPGDDDHCAICHWLRALTHSVRGATVKGPQFAIVRFAPAAAVFGHVSEAVTSAPARAPPSLL